MRRTFSMIAASGSALLLLGAFGFEHIGDMAPCKMCIWARWPHGAAVLVGLIGALFSRRIIALMGGCAALTTALISTYHAGVEQGWWEGPSTCTAQPLGEMSAAEALAKILEAPVVRCDEIPWELFSISMAGWNAIVSFGLVAIWLLAAATKR